jgi:small subunit ribosomal protein S20
MPHTKSAKKRLRQNEKRRLRNRVAKKALKKQVKLVVATAATGTAEELQAQFNKANQKLDRSAAKGVIHKNTAARKKSQLVKLLNQKKAAAKAAPAG